MAVCTTADELIGSMTARCAATVEQLEEVEGA